MMIQVPAGTSMSLCRGASAQAKLCCMPTHLGECVTERVTVGLSALCCGAQVTAAAWPAQPAWLAAFLVVLGTRITHEQTR